MVSSSVRGHVASFVAPRRPFLVKASRRDVPGTAIVRPSALVQPYPWRSRHPLEIVRRPIAGQPRQTVQNVVVIVGTRRYDGL